MSDFEHREDGETDDSDLGHTEVFDGDEPVAGGGVAIRSVEEHFERRAHYFSTRTSDGYHAIDRGTNESVLLWLLRHPIGPDSEAAHRFINRFDLVGRLSGITAPIRCYGVDAAGVAFLVTDFLEGVPLVEVKVGMAALQAFFVEAVRKVAVLHQRGVLLGDISDHSFLVAKGNKVHLLAALGTFDVEASQTTMLPPPNTLHYVSPEQRSGSGVTLASDVYALGVLGYRLFTGRFMYGDKPPMLGAEEQAKLVPSPSTLVKGVPPWADAVLGRCVELQAGNRFRDAGELLHTVERAIKTGEVPEGGGRWSQKTELVDALVPSIVKDPRALIKQRPRDVSSSARSREVGATKARKERPQRPQREIVVSKNVILFAAGLVVAVLLAGTVFLLFQGGEELPVAKDLPIRPSDLPPDLRPHLTDFFSTSSSLKSKKEALARIAESDEPIAYSVLVYAVRNVTHPELVIEAERLIVQRVKRDGMTRTSEFLASWFNATRAARTTLAQSGIYLSMLRACDTNMPIESRQTAVHKVYPENPTTALQLAAGLALDEISSGNGQVEGTSNRGFMHTLRELVSAHTGQPGLADKGIGPLLIADSELALVYRKEVIEFLPKYSGDDLRWSLGRLSQTDDTLLMQIAGELAKRKVLPPFQTVFLNALVQAEPTNLPSGVKKALVEGARGEVTERGVLEVGRWFDPNSESVLLAIAAVADNEELQLAAFDSLTARDIASEPARSLAEWVKGRLWDERAKVAKSIGILGLVDVAGTEEVEYAFDTILPFSGQASLLRVFIKTGIPKLILSMLDRTGELAPNADLIPLLTHSDKRIRMAVIRVLTGRNDLSVLQAVLRAYENEQDPEVKQLYHDLHWVTRNRM